MINEIAKEKENQRRESNQRTFEPIGLSVITKFCNDNQLTFIHKERTAIDYQGVDFIITINESDIPTAFRVIKNAKTFCLRYSGGLGGESEAQKIMKDTTKALVYATFDMNTKVLSFYKISDIKKWLMNENRSLKIGNDGSRYYQIPFGDLKAIKEIQM